MASGHVNRIKRPNTWLHRPMLQNVKKALANPEPSTHGTKLPIRDVRYLVAIGGNRSAPGDRQGVDGASPSR
jgi:hypothetical protein